MKEKVRLRRKGSGEKEAQELWFAEGIEVPKVYLEAPLCCSVFQNEIDQQFLRDHPELSQSTASTDKPLIRESEIFSKSGRCGVCRCSYSHYSEHIASAAHISAFQSLHDSYASLDSLLQGFRRQPEKLASIFLPAAIKRRAEFPAFSPPSKSAKVDSSSIE